MAANNYQIYPANNNRRCAAPIFLLLLTLYLSITSPVKPFRRPAEAAGVVSVLQDGEHRDPNHEPRERPQG
ncbi:MAG: hypothetical protein EBZ77_03465, partial [Chitinophagia bacterium]|nr:hypothetical protein [Chitinophagia bacterium]